MTERQGGGCWVVCNSSHIHSWQWLVQAHVLDLIDFLEVKLVKSPNRVSLASKMVRQKLVGNLLLCLRRIKMLDSGLLVLMSF